MELNINVDLVNKLPIRKATNNVLWHLKQGIGVSRKGIERDTKKPSPFIHSFSIYTRYVGVIKEFADDMKKQGVKRFVDVKYEHVKAWLEHKTSYCTEKTLKVNMCALEKLFSAINRNDISDSIRRDFVDMYSKAKASGRA
ncbi:hypothetical protein, partial [Hydrogenobaculum acidophilum]